MQIKVKTEKETYGFNTTGLSFAFSSSINLYREQQFVEKRNRVNFYSNMNGMVVLSFHFSV